MGGQIASECARTVEEKMVEALQGHPMSGDSGISDETRLRPVDANSITRFLSSLLGSDVQACSAVPHEFTEKDGMVATYFDDSDLVALCLCGIDTVTKLATSASLIDESDIEPALRVKQIDTVVSDRLHALFTLMESLFVPAASASRASQLILRDLVFIDEVASEVRSLLECCSAQTVVDISIQGRPCGQLAVLAI